MVSGGYSRDSSELSDKGGEIALQELSPPEAHLEESRCAGGRYASAPWGAEFRVNRCRSDGEPLIEPRADAVEVPEQQTRDSHLAASLQAGDLMWWALRSSPTTALSCCRGRNASRGWLPIAPRSAAPAW